MTESLEVLIAPEDMQGLIHSAYVAGCAAVHENYQPDEDPDFTEAGYDYVASLDFTTTTRPARSEGPPSPGYDGGKSLGERLIAAVQAMADDFQTSPKHHPDHVLVPLPAFEELRAAAVTFTASLSGGEGNDGLPSQPCGDGALPILPANTDDTGKEG